MQTGRAASPAAPGYAAHGGLCSVERSYMWTPVCHLERKLLLLLVCKLKAWDLCVILDDNNFLFFSVCLVRSSLLCTVFRL